MSEVKPEAVGTGSLPVESAAGETNDVKTEERTTVEIKEGGEDALEKELQEELAAHDKDIDTVTAKKEEAEETTATKQEQVEKTESQKEDAVIQEAVKQITFYLSDSNLPYDRHLFTLSQAKKAENAPMGTGFIPLSQILEFKRMQAILNKSSRSPTICEFAIVNALRAAYPTKDENALLEISGDGQEIRRKKALTPPGQTGQLDRSVYAKGFPDEEEQQQERDGKDRKGGGGNYAFSELQKSLETWFESLNCGRVNAVRMRRDEKKKFKNSVFVEFATEESAQTFLALDPKPTYFGQSEPLEAMSKKDYIDMKAKEKGIEPTYGENKQASTRPQFNKRAFNAFKDADHMGNDNRRGDRRNGDSGWGKDEKSGPVMLFVEGKEMEVDQETGMIKNQEDIEYTAGKVLKFGGAVNNDEANPLELKKALTEIHPAVFVDFDRARGQGAAFFKDPVDDRTLQRIQGADFTLGGPDAKLKWIFLTGEEEKQYHVDRANKRASIALADSKSGNNRNGGGGRGGRGGDRGRGGRGGRGGGRGGDRDRGGRGGRGGNNSRGGDRRDNRDRDSRPSDRNDEKKNDRKRDREEDSAPAQKGNAIGVPVPGSSGPAPDPPAKKAKTEDA